MMSVAILGQGWLGRTVCGGYGGVCSGVLHGYSGLFVVAMVGCALVSFMARADCVEVIAIMRAN